MSATETDFKTPATVSFTLAIPHKKVTEILEAAGIPTRFNNDEGLYERACDAVQNWVEEEWPRRLDWITSTPDVEVTDLA